MDFAEFGGIAVHLMGSADKWLAGKSARVIRAFGGKDFAHLFGPSIEILYEAATSIGCNTTWIQHPNNPRRMHFDITGAMLKRALKRCKDND